MGASICTQNRCILIAGADAGPSSRATDTTDTTESPAPGTPDGTNSPSSSDAGSGD